MSDRMSVGTEGQLRSIVKSWQDHDNICYVGAVRERLGYVLVIMVQAVCQRLVWVNNTQERLWPEVTTKKGYATHFAPDNMVR